MSEYYEESGLSNDVPEGNESYEEIEDPLPHPADIEPQSNDKYSGEQVKSVLSWSRNTFSAIFSWIMDGGRF